MGFTADPTRRGRSVNVKVVGRAEPETEKDENIHRERHAGIVTVT